MNDRTEPSKAHGSAPASGSDIEAVRRNARRRLLKGGLGAAPVVLTVTSRPVLAGGGGTCHGPTGFHSANMSRGVGKTPCQWPKPTDWCNSEGTDWPEYCKNRKTNKFTTVFGCGDKDGRVTTSMSCLAVIKNTGTSESEEIAKLVMTAWLNCRQYGNSFPMKESQVMEIWKEHNTTGFRPGGDTVAWDGSKIKKYLLYTMGIAT